MFSRLAPPQQAAAAAEGSSSEGNPQDDGDQQQFQERMPLMQGLDDDPLLPPPPTAAVSGNLPSPSAATSSTTATTATISSSPAKSSLFRSRKKNLGNNGGGGGGSRHNQKKRRHHGGGGGSSSASAPPPPPSGNSILPSNTFSNCMDIISRMVLWLTIVSLAAAVVWYSYELYNHGTDPHLIAWFSAGAFVLLGFPISMFGIVSHLANYNQPHVQVYVVRILWMVPIYSIESWLAMRFHKHAIYIETLRDLYESFVLYSFLQFLIQVLGGEEALILMLKDKSPTRGVHMWGLQWCVEPWLMGQPVRKISIYEQRQRHSALKKASVEPLTPDELGASAAASAAIVADQSAQSSEGPVVVPTPPTGRRAMKRVHWKSPFFIKCKFGVLQYVLLKFVFSIAVFILELYGLYKEGDFTPKGGYLYICILTNLSQCWALYCLIFFYYATRTELAPIRPVGKFLSVKSLVFFTWWQSVAISIFYQMGMIQGYSVGEKDQPVESDQSEDWNLTAEDVSKAIQDYLICIEMFLAAVVHIFVFPHTEYTPQAVQARTKALSHNYPTSRWHHKKKRLGRKYYNMWKDDGSKSSTTNDNLMVEMELSTFDSGNNSVHTAEEIWERGGLVNVGFGIDSTTGAHAAAVPMNMQGRSPNRSRASSIDSNDDSNDGAMLEAVPSWELEDAIMRPPVGSAASQQALVGAITEEDEDLHSEKSSLLQQDSDYEDVEMDNDKDDEDDGGGLSDDADTVTSKNPGFVRALLDSAIPLDLRDNTVGIVKGDYRIEKKTLLHHATTSDQYDIFSHRRRPFGKRNQTPPPDESP